MRRQVPSPLTGALILCTGCIALTFASGRQVDKWVEVRNPGTGVGRVGAPAPTRNAAFYHPFACELFRRVGATGGNLLLSPHTISKSLAMARTGAAGETARQMDTLLRLPVDAPNAYRYLAEALAYTPPAPVAVQERNQSPREPPGFTTEAFQPILLDDNAEYSLTLSNGIFFQRGSEFSDAFRRSVTADFAVEFLEVDFASPAEARSAINRWVEGKTNKRITQIVPDGLPTAETRMVLADAIFFKASWDEAFAESETVDGPFWVAEGRVVTAKRMRQTGRMNYGETQEAHLLEIPYRRGNTAMIIVLPRAKDGLDTLVKSMTAEKIQSWTSTMRKKKVALEELGMTDAFSPEKANFSGITAREPLFIDALLHKGFVAVDEKGTEAAAAAATVVLLSGGDFEKPVPFVVDHPFLFLIRHAKTGAILFMGRVVDPTAT